MQLTEFSALPGAEQLDRVRREGVYIGKRVEGSRKVLLYQLDSFYVEIFYRSYRRQMDCIVLSQDVNHLTPYLQQIEVGFLDMGKS